MVFSIGISPDLKDDRTEATSAPSDGAELLRIIALLVDEVNLVKDFLDLFKADSVFSFDLAIFLRIELKAHGLYITLIPSSYRIRITR